MLTNFRCLLHPNIRDLIANLYKLNNFPPKLATIVFRRILGGQQDEKNHSFFIQEKFKDFGLDHIELQHRKFLITPPDGNQLNIVILQKTIKIKLLIKRLSVNFSLK